MRKEYIAEWKEHYEERGCVVPLCEECGKIKWNNIEWPKGPGIIGPSISSGMWCTCKQGDKK